MKETQQRGQANYSHARLRADRDRTHQQTAWVINTFCHLHSHLYSRQFTAKIIKLGIPDFYAKHTMQGGLRGWKRGKNNEISWAEVIIGNINWGWDTG